MKKIMPYKILIATCILTMFVLVGVTATQFTNYRQESEQTASQIIYNNELNLQRIARDVTVLVLDTKSLDAETVYVYDFIEDTVIFEKNSETPRNLASFAKIILARMVLDTPLIDTDVCMTEAALAAVNDQSLVAGDCYSVPEAIKAMLVSSSNDLASAIGNQAQEYGFMLDEYIKSKNMDMVVYDPSGFDFGDEAKTSRGYARDVLESAYEILIKNPEIARATTQRTYPLGNVSVQHTYPNVENIPGLRFAKTGFTSLAGGNMMAIFEPGPGALVGIVVMRSGFETRFSDFESIVATIQSAYNIIR
jgi:D-alanyl-D-alanine carboxypeptidase